MKKYETMEDALVVERKRFPLFRTKYGDIGFASLPYILFHLTPIAAFFLPFNWGLVALALFLFGIRMLAVTGFYHRYFSHRGYKIRNRIVQFLVGLWGTTAVQKGPIWWANHHRMHHKFSDQPNDIHSPKQHGIIFAHMGWIFFVDRREDMQHHEPKDLTKFPELVWLDKYWLIGPILLGIALFAIGGLPYLTWGLGISTVLTWHGTYTINSLMHLWGRKRFDTTDTSRNSILLAIITMGEGWHNNHHYYQGGAKAGFHWYEWDPTYYMLWTMNKLGLVQDLGKPPVRVLEKRRANDKIQKEVRRFVRAGVIKNLTFDEMELLLNYFRSEEKVRNATRTRKKMTLADVRKILEDLTEKQKNLFKGMTESPIPA